MKEHPLVTVVVPCLNREHFLVPTIESVLQQDYPYIECIVVDGGSTDGTIDVLKRYEGQIRWVSEPDNSAADAINKGWQMSKGEILAWLNADDIWAVPSAVSQVVEYLQTHPGVDVVYGDCGAIDIQGNLIGMSYLHKWDLEYAMEYCDHCIPQPAAFIRRSIIEKVGWLDTTLLFMDRDLWCRIGLVGKIEHIPVVLAHARRGPSYWDSKVHIAAENCVRITRKFYNLPDIPSSIRARKHRAISNSYLRGADYAFAKGRHWRIIFGYSIKAALVDPTNGLNVYRRLIVYIITRAAEDRRLKCFLQLYRSLVLSKEVLRRAKSYLIGSVRPQIPNLLGDRCIEWSWVASKMPLGPGQALDFGPGGSYLGLIAAQRGFNVTAVDLESPRWPYLHPHLRFVQGDILKLPLPEEHFDLVVNCSTVEHVGISGRYGVTESCPDGDFEAMARLKELMKPGGVMLLTIPVGRDKVFVPLHRVYGAERLPRLLNGYTIEDEEYWVKNQQNNWILTDKQDALTRDAQERLYGLGCFVLGRLGV